MKYFISIVWVCCILLVACGEKLSPGEYIAYVRSEQNGLKRIHAENGLTIEAQFEPAEYLAMKELRGQQLTPTAFKREEQKFTDYYYFSLSFNSDSGSILDKKDSVNYNSRYNYFGFHLNENVFLLNGQDTLHCLISQLDAGSFSGTCSFELMFEKKALENNDGQFDLILNIPTAILGLPETKIAFDAADLKKVPPVKI